MCHSYVMGIGSKIEALRHEGFIIEHDGENYTATFAKEKSQRWEQFIIENLEINYWNEYISENNVVFIFKLKDGVKRYNIINYTNDEVLKLCEQLCECKFESIKAMLIDNHFYKTKLMR